MRSTGVNYSRVVFLQESTNSCVGYLQFVPEPVGDFPPRPDNVPKLARASDLINGYKMFFRRIVQNLLPP
jgi:hypothetical protein